MDPSQSRADAYCQVPVTFTCTEGSSEWAQASGFYASLTGGGFKGYNEPLLWYIRDEKLPSDIGIRINQSFLFHPKVGGNDSQFDGCIFFSKWVGEKPPISSD